MPTRDYLKGVLLSLVVIFTQSIQMSKIMKAAICHYRALGRFEHFCPRLNLNSCCVMLQAAKRFSLG